MTVSGLLLWFVDLTLHYLPSQGLTSPPPSIFTKPSATLSMLVRHVYWVILTRRHPVDWTFWISDSPASRVLARVSPRFVCSDAPPRPTLDAPSDAPYVPVFRRRSVALLPGDVATPTGARRFGYRIRRKGISGVSSAGVVLSNATSRRTASVFDVFLNRR
jgi:hypothetical protein